MPREHFNNSLELLNKRLRPSLRGSMRWLKDATTRNSGRLLLALGVGSFLLLTPAISQSHSLIDTEMATPVSVQPTPENQSLCDDEKRKQSPKKLLVLHGYMGNPDGGVLSEYKKILNLNCIDFEMPPLTPSMNPEDEAFKRPKLQDQLNIIKRVRSQTTKPIVEQNISLGCIVSLLSIQEQVLERQKNNQDTNIIDDFIGISCRNLNPDEQELRSVDPNIRHFYTSTPLIYELLRLGIKGDIVGIHGSMDGLYRTSGRKLDSIPRGRMLPAINGDGHLVEMRHAQLYWELVKERLK